MKKKFFYAIVSVLMIMNAIMIFFPNVVMKVSAKEEITDSYFKIKRINKGTGVKIQINKTPNATRYNIRITEGDNIFSEYMVEKSLYFDYNLMLDGKKKRNFSFKCLPEGNYTFEVVAYEDFESKSEEIWKSKQSVIIKAPELEEKKEKAYDFSKVKAGDIIKFGSFEQDGNMINGQEDIEWIVLSRTKKELFIMSKNSLVLLPFNKSPYNGWECDNTWKNSTLRTWLNKEFYNQAFTDSEKRMIAYKKIKTEQYSEEQVKSEYYTKDRVFVLSYPEVTNPEYGFLKYHDAFDVKRRCAPSEYANMVSLNFGLYFGYKTNELEDSYNWWLRSPMKVEKSDSKEICWMVHVNGELGMGADFIWGTNLTFGEGVRPALYLDIS